MKARSPVLGYNHNVRYAGRLWHVQTEDSGVANPHIFTHLFHDGTILATKRLDYDPASEVAAVQKLMQTQHKALLRELKAGVFDEKIGKFFGEPVVRQSEEESTDPNSKPPIEIVSGPEEEVSPDELPSLPLSGARTEPATPVPPLPRPKIPSVGRAPTVPALSATDRPATNAPPATNGSQATHARPSTNAPPSSNAPPSTNAPPSSNAPPATSPRPFAPPPSSAHAPRMPAAGLGGRRPTTAHPPAYASKPSAEGVVVARPAVIIGGEGTTPRGVPATRPPAPVRPLPQSSTRWNSPAPQPAPPAGRPAQTPSPTPTIETAPPGAQPPPAGGDSIFGGDLISEKSLDEVILAYLSEDMTEK